MHAIAELRYNRLSEMPEPKITGRNSMSGVGESYQKASEPQTIQEEVILFLAHVKQTQSPAVYASNHQAMQVFFNFLTDYSPEDRIDFPPQLNADVLRQFLTHLQDAYSPETEHAYLRAVTTWIAFLTSKGLVHEDLNQECKSLSQKIRRKKPKPEPQIPFDLIGATQALVATYPIPSPNPDLPIQRERLRVLRDKALIFTIIDTGLKASEITDLRVHSVDHSAPSVTVRGIFLSIKPTTSLAIRDYLNERQPLDQQQQGLTLSSLPLFARHDKRASTHILAITRWTVGNIIAFWSNQAANSSSGEGHSVTPSQVRHHFVATTLDATQDLQLTQLRARHKDKSTTRHYLPKPDPTLHD